MGNKKQVLEQMAKSCWNGRLSGEVNHSYFSELSSFLEGVDVTKRVYPAVKDIFRAFELTPFERVKVVILGQDPYHGAGEADGLCFSVANGVRIPPSLRNILKELEQELGIVPPRSGDLSAWARQGVLLLNATLTVEADRAGSHQGRGWEEFTDEVIRQLNVGCEGLVFMLWGAYAQRKGGFIDQNRHLVLSSAHPSPLSAYRGFFGNNHFVQANNYLTNRGVEPIDWQL